MVEDVLKSFGEKIVDKLRDDIKNKPLPRRKGKSYVANASGDLEKTLNFKVEDGKLKVYANDYIYYLLYGRKPGKFPPKAPIIQWIKDKGIKSDIPINSLAFLIQRSIANEGTLLYPAGSDLLSSIVNDELISDLKSALFTEIVDAAVESFKTIKRAA